MRYNQLKGTGLRVSRVCLGTMTFGGQVGEAEGVEMIHKAVDLGVNFFDTANVYTDGRSEQITGKALAGRRDKVILASKVGMQLGVYQSGTEYGLSRRGILANAEASLKRLGTDYLDIYYIHAPDHHTAFEETLEAMTSLVRSGKVRYIGVSNHAAWQICEQLWISDKRGGAAPAVTQTVYNLVTRGIEQELLPFVRQHDIGVVVYNPLAGGLLTGKHTYEKAQENSRLASNEDYRSRYWNESNFEAVEKLKSIAERSGYSLAQLSLMWCNSREEIDSTIIGVSQMNHFAENIACFEGGPLSLEVMRECEDVWNEVKGNSFSYIR